MGTRTRMVEAYSLTDAAKLLGLSRWTLHRAVLDGKLTVHKAAESKHSAVIVYAADLLDYVLRERGGKGIEA